MPAASPLPLTDSPEQALCGSRLSGGSNVSQQRRVDEGGPVIRRLDPQPVTDLARDPHLLADLQHADLIEMRCWTAPQVRPLDGPHEPADRDYINVALAVGGEPQRTLGTDLRPSKRRRR